MPALKLIKADLARHGQARYEEGQGFLRVFPLDDAGFEVAFHEGERPVVTFGRCRRRFPGEDLALVYFALALSNAARLEISACGGSEHRWTFQRRLGEEWIACFATRRLLVPFWRERRVSYRQNHFIRGD
jgi:hypothetical protein